MFVSLWTLSSAAFAQNWRTPNPNQPNGYRATEAAYHFHGSYKEPSSPSNGYRATEARSRAGMSCFAPPSSSEKSEGGRWAGNEGRWGGSESRRWGNATGSSFQSGAAMQNRQEEWNEFYKRRFEATEQGGYNNAMQAEQPRAEQRFANAQQFTNTYPEATAVGTSFNGYAQPGESFGSAQAMRAAVGASAVRRMLRNGGDGSFNRVYNSNSGGFNRIYASD